MINHSLKLNVALLIAIISLGINGFLLFENMGKKKIAYVRSSELVYNYLGMKEAHSKYDEKTQVWKANVDTLQKEYQHDLSDFSARAAKLSETEKKTLERQLSEKQQNVVGYVQAINTKVQKEDKKMTEGVLNQINSFVETYGKEHGYDIILGTTLSGSLLYGDKGIDITDEVLAALNKSYQGEGK